MHNLDNIVTIYYNAVSACTILAGKIVYHKFPREEFSKLCRAYITQYSETENTNLYDYAERSYFEMGHPFARIDEREALNVYAALEELSEQLLTLEGNEVRCAYEHLLRFREITQYIDEDLLICAYLAVYNKNYSKRIYPKFNWNIAIGHNNVQLRCIMARGISDNHFHLFGSAPHFHLIWIYFMNHVRSAFVCKLANEIDARQRMTREHYSVEYTEDCFEVKILKAALIRVHIIQYLMGQSDYCFAVTEHMEDILSGETEIRAHVSEVQGCIDYFRNYTYFMTNEALIDYAVYMVKDLDYAKAEQYWLAGERWMIYEMLYKELTGEGEKDRNYYQWFYAYLVLKNNIRNELVQSNDTIGFENFSVYNKRKYIDDRKMIEAAVYESVETGNIKSLEIRIKPERHACDNAKKIREIDCVIMGRENPLPKSDYYYVFHFAKVRDLKAEEYAHDKCRHYTKRRHLREQAKAIADFRERYRELASEVLGIDACSQEIGCRPEVFARVFRYLSMHMVNDVVGLEQIKQLKKTFHVGEDFLDVVDGLRAIDEAVHFLNLGYGDRIGHGTVLGIDVKKWYSGKRNTILLPKQDYLDNVVWLFHKLTEYKIVGMDHLRTELIREFELCFDEVYAHLFNRETQENLQYNIYVYYEAWKLRGDEPELYRSGSFEKSECLDNSWVINEKYPENFASRKSWEIAYLYYLYHYDKSVRENGEKVKEYRVSPAVIEGICAVQKAMQSEFASLGIGIETNPSSNIAISSIQGYDEHPIVTLYNKDLTWDMEQARACPQAYVSINTDDKGIFHTSLENEYALMACAMENAKDENGNSIYNRQMIYQWLDNIREMGNMQSFREQKYKEKNI